MSLFGAINTAVSGLTAQSTAFGNISEDVANSQTVGFKRIDTSFKDYLTTSTATENVPGAVVATPDYVNNIQGTVTQTDNPLGLAIAGQGFFAVSQPTGEASGKVTFNSQQFYTRAGDFTMNATGYLVNSAGQYLNGWTVTPATGVADQNALVPIQVNQSTYNPVATTSVTLAANLPATPTAGTASAAILASPALPAVAASAGPPVIPALAAIAGVTAAAASPLSSQITVYDSLGTAHTVTLNWVKNSTNNWTVQVQVPDAKATLADGITPNYTDAGSATVVFGVPAGAAAGTTLPNAGTIDSITAVNVTTAVTTGLSTAGPATDSISVTQVGTATTPTIYTEVSDDGTGSATGLTTTITTVPPAAVPGTPGVPLVTTINTRATSGVAGTTNTSSIAADGTKTFVSTVDSGAAFSNTSPPTGGTVITTLTVPPPAGTLGGNGQYVLGANPQQAAALTFVTNFGSNDQTINLNLGTYGGTTGVTQFAGSTYSLLGLTQDGVAPGSFSGVTTQDSGNVVINYNNGQTRTIAQIPLVTFNAPNSLQSQNGQSFTATPSSGSPLAQAASTNGAGNLVTGSIEGSNVDIATQFTNLIVTQQAYSSNAKVVTTANAMLQATLQMIA